MKSIGLPVISIPNNTTKKSKSSLATQIIGAKNKDKSLLQLALRIFNATKN